MAPFFVFIYYWFTGASQPRYDLLILNKDKGIEKISGKLNHGSLLIENITTVARDSLNLPLTVKVSDNKSESIEKLKNKKADALVIIPENFSENIQSLASSNFDTKINIEFVGDLTNMNYMISAVWANEMINDYIFEATRIINPLSVRETALGLSGNIDDFDYLVPGLLILSIIMLMFSATVALVTEVEHKTIIRLKLSKVTAFEFLSGVGFIQVLVGLISILLTLGTAVWLGFSYTGSFFNLLLIAVLTSISIIAFSLILAAITKSVNEVLIISNFPLFLFMFFTGAAFPIKGIELFSFAGYPFTLQGFMSPTHSVNALKKLLVLNMGIGDVLPEITSLICLTVIYFFVGVYTFRQRHMKIE
jgi:ABC-2 type transport system permease protein